MNKITTEQMKAMRAAIIASYDNHAFDVRSMLIRVAHDIAGDASQPEGLREICAELVIAGCKCGFGAPRDMRTKAYKMHRAELGRIKSCGGNNL